MTLESELLIIFGSECHLGNCDNSTYGMNAICYVSFVSTLGNVKAIDKVKARYVPFTFSTKNGKTNIVLPHFLHSMSAYSFTKDFKKDCKWPHGTPKSKEDEELLPDKYKDYTPKEHCGDYKMDYKKPIQIWGDACPEVKTVKRGHYDTILQGVDWFYPEEQNELDRKFESRVEQIRMMSNYRQYNKWMVNRDTRYPESEFDLEKTIQIKDCASKIAVTTLPHFKYHQLCMDENNVVQTPNLVWSFYTPNSHYQWNFEGVKSEGGINLGNLSPYTSDDFPTPTVATNPSSTSQRLAELDMGFSYYFDEDVRVDGLETLRRDCGRWLYPYPCEIFGEKPTSVSHCQPCAPKDCLWDSFQQFKDFCNKKLEEKDEEGKDYEDRWRAKTTDYENEKDAIWKEMSGVRHKMTAFFPHDSSGEGGAQFREFGEDFYMEEEQEIYGGSIRHYYACQVAKAEEDWAGYVQNYMYTLCLATREGGLSAEETEWRNDAFNSRRRLTGWYDARRRLTDDESTTSIIKILEGKYEIKHTQTSTQNMKPVIEYLKGCKDKLVDYTCDFSGLKQTMLNVSIGTLDWEKFDNDDVTDKETNLYLLEDNDDLNVKSFVELQGDTYRKHLSMLLLFESSHKLLSTREDKLAKIKKLLTNFERVRPPAEMTSALSWSVLDDERREKIRSSSIDGTRSPAGAALGGFLSAIIGLGTTASLTGCYPCSLIANGGSAALAAALGAAAGTTAGVLSRQRDTEYTNVCSKFQSKSELIINDILEEFSELYKDEGLKKVFEDIVEKELQPFTMKISVDESYLGITYDYKKEYTWDDITKNLFKKEGKDGTRTEFWKRLNQYGFHVEDEYYRCSRDNYEDYCSWEYYQSPCEPCRDQSSKICLLSWFDFNLAKYYGTIISSFETRPEYMQALQNHLNLLNSITEIRDQILKEIQIKLVNSGKQENAGASPFAAIESAMQLGLPIKRIDTPITKLPGNNHHKNGEIFLGNGEMVELNLPYESSTECNPQPNAAYSVIRALDISNYKKDIAFQNEQMFQGWHFIGSQNDQQLWYHLTSKDSSKIKHAPNFYGQKTIIGCSTQNSTYCVLIGKVTAQETPTIGIGVK